MTYFKRSKLIKTLKKCSLVVMGEQIKDFPYEVEVLNPQQNQELANELKGHTEDFIRIGPKKYFMTDVYMADAASIYNLQLRPDDTFVTTFSRSGTTLTQELVWLICNNLDYKKAQSRRLTERFPFLECGITNYKNRTVHMEEKKAIEKYNIKQFTIKEVTEMPSPRFLKSHLPLSLLPPSLLDNTKVVYITRDPRDVAVSFYHHYKLAKIITSEVKFKTFWNCFISDNVLYAPYFQHVLEAWEQRNHPNMLFMFYEEMIQDMPAAIRRVANFLGKPLTNEQINKLVDHLDIDNFRKNKSVNYEHMQKAGVYTSEGAFIRKGKSGGWRDYFDEEMTAQAETWIADNLRHTDFPHF